MAESTNELRKTLTELHAQLESGGELDDDVRSMLVHTVAEIHGLLDRRDESADASVAAPANSDQEADQGDESIIARLRSAEQHFEQSHPTLSGVLGSVVDALSRMGI